MNYLERRGAVDNYEVMEPAAIAQHSFFRSGRSLAAAPESGRRGPARQTGLGREGIVQQLRRGG